jgi:Tfp pilus assembly protein PilV
MRPIAHHAAEDSLLSLLVLGGGGLSVAAAIARAWLATTHARWRSRCKMTSR